MATAAFRSRTRRSTFSNPARREAAFNRGSAPRCSRNLTRDSGCLPPSSAETYREESSPSGARTNNNSSVCGCSDISLEDLTSEIVIRREEDEAIKETQGHSSRKGDAINIRTESDALRERGSSVSKCFELPLAGESQSYWENGADNRKTSRCRSRKQQSFSMPGKRFCDSEPDKHKQDLVSRFSVQEQVNLDQSKVMNDFLPGKKPACLAKSRSISKRRSRDKRGMSKYLTDDEEKHIEEFLSNIEDADISSSFDDDQSDASSIIGGISKFSTIEEMHENQLRLASLSVGSEGIRLSLLNVESCNEGSSPSEDKSSLSNYLCVLGSSLKESVMASVDRDRPAREQVSPKPEASGQTQNSSSLFFMDDLNNPSFSEDIAVARYMQRQRIESGNLIICGKSLI